MVIRGFVLVLISLVLHSHADAKSYIRYHQRSLVAQEYMLQGEHTKALALLDELEKRYGLMPTETFSRALCQVAIGDTAAARKSYMKSLEQRASLGWFYTSPPEYRSTADSFWYASVVKDAETFWNSRPQYADGPNPGMPTVVTRANLRHQFVLDSLGWFDPATQPEAQRAYDAVVEQHDRLLDSIITGEVPVPSIATYGVNGEFETLVFHCSSNLTNSKRRHFKRWLKQGLIYPRVYAICFDDLANETGKPIPYGVFNGLRPEELAPGYAKRRAAIGMGDDRMDKLRFHWGG